MKRNAGAALILTMMLIAAGVSGIRTTYSFLSDFDSAVNPVTPGSNETEITEDFPDTPPKPPGDNPVYNKTVQIASPNIGGTNVTCFIRARILFSNSDLGDAAVLEGMDTRWVKEADGYYYYSSPVSEGETTAPLFTKVRIDSSRVSDQISDYIEDFKITIYEESVQAADHTDYRSAFAEFVPGSV